MWRFIIKHRIYAGYVLRHKWYVWLECLKYGLVWQGLIHDWSKFLPSEWIPYANYFAPGNVTRRSDGTLIADPDFDAAWNHHQNVNPHHWQYWVLWRDNGEIQALDMPLRYRQEMMADWRAMSRAQKNGDTRAWYLKFRSRMTMHPFTRSWVEGELDLFRPMSGVSVVEPYED